MILPVISLSKVRVRNKAEEPQGEHCFTSYVKNLSMKPLCCFMLGCPISACIQKALCEHWTCYSAPLLRHGSLVALVKLLSIPSLVSMPFGLRKAAKSWAGWMEDAAVQLHGS